MIERDIKKNQEQVPAGRAAALYIHVPFCTRKCRYCDFYSVPLEADTAAGYVRALVVELSRRLSLLTTPLASVFVGGGTPTVLGTKPLRELLAPLGALTDGRTEFTVEANPATLDAPLIDVLRRAGVNRVSVGAQSFQEGELGVLGRGHTPNQVARAVESLREGGVANISLDLIYGIPGQTLDSWTDTLRQATNLGAEHLSCYALSLEEGTALERDVREGRLPQPNESLHRAMYEAAIDHAGEAGMEHYEISNFARVGRRCRHNLTYWRKGPYLGLGPAAASYIGGVRRKTDEDIHAYLRAVQIGQDPPATSECLTGRREMAETIMLGLRMTEGIDRQGLIARFGRDPLEAFPRSTGKYVKLGALEVTPRTIRLVRKALFVADTVLADILDEA